MKIYVMGNVLVDIDSLPMRIIEKLRKAFPNIEFIEFDPSENFPKEKTLNIIDTVLDIDKVVLIKDIDKIRLANICSLHDFDLGYNLKIMKKFDMIDKVNILGVPPDLTENAAVAQIKKIITNLF